MFMILDEAKMAKLSKWLPSPGGVLIGIIIIFVELMSATGGDVFIQLHGHEGLFDFLTIPKLGKSSLLLILFGLWVGFVPAPANVWLVSKVRKLFRGKLWDIK